ncbi:Endo-1,4-beta-xylanase, partial [Leucoagaricus sp. SymC.cos]
LSDAPYKAILSGNKEFGIVTPGNSMKWDATEPSRGTFTFTNGDVIASLAKANGQMIRGHTTVWHSQLPSWVTSGNFGNSTLISIMQNHVTNVISHYKGQIKHKWLIAVIINDYNIEGTGAKSTAMYNLVKSLKNQSIPIDGIGIQGHLIVGAVPTTIQQNLEQFTSLGVEVAITELDIRMTLPVTDALLEQQKKDYQTVVAACKAVAKCVGVTIWDYTDKYSWIPSVFNGQGAALPWDENLVKKPAYDGIAAGWTQ